MSSIVDRISKAIAGFQKQKLPIAAIEESLIKKTVGDISRDTVFPFIKKNTQAMFRIYIPTHTKVNDWEKLKQKEGQEAIEEAQRIEGEVKLKWRDYNNFILQRVTEVDIEKVQIMPVFQGEDMVFAFGRKPRIFTYSGNLINTQKNVDNHIDWLDEFLAFYEDLRVSNFVDRETLGHNNELKKKYKMYFYYDNILIRGYLLSCAIEKSALQKELIPISFNILVRKMKHILTTKETFLPPPAPKKQTLTDKDHKDKLKQLSDQKDKVPDPKEKSDKWIDPPFRERGGRETPEESSGAGGSWGEDVPDIFPRKGSGG